jgi:hypothetical protein
MGENTADDIDWTCETCGVGSSFIIPVWEDISDYYKEGTPDYLGCTECHTMRPLGADSDRSERDSDD